MTIARAPLHPSLRTALSGRSVAQVQRFVTPTPHRSAHRIREDLGGRTPQGDTIWLLAARDGALDIMELLAPLVVRHHRNDEGRDALQFAAANGRTDVVDALLTRWTASPRAVDHQNITALMAAAQHGDLATVQRLVDVSDVNACDIHGLNALEYALQQTHWPVADFLALAMPVEEVHRTLDTERTSLEQCRVGHAVDVPRRLPHWTVQQERWALREALTADAQPAENGPPGPALAAPRSRPRL